MNDPKNEAAGVLAGDCFTGTGVVSLACEEEEEEVGPFAWEEGVVVPFACEEEEEVMPFACEEEGVVVPFAWEEGVVVPFACEEEGVVVPFACEEEGVVVPFAWEEGVVVPFAWDEGVRSNMLPDGSIRSWSGSANRRTTSMSKVS